MLRPKATTWKGLTEIIKNNLDEEVKKKEEEVALETEKAEADKESVGSEYKPGGLFYIDKESFEARSNKSSQLKLNKQSSKLSISKQSRSPNVPTNSGRYMLGNSPKQLT